MEDFKSQAEELDSVLPMALAVGDYWTFLSRDISVESLVWGGKQMEYRGEANQELLYTFRHEVVPAWVIWGCS